MAAELTEPLQILKVDQKAEGIAGWGSVYIRPSRVPGLMKEIIGLQQRLNGES